MRYFLDYLEPFKEEALFRYKQGERPSTLLFSGATYQISFSRRGGDDHWVFMQIDPKRGGAINDLFCSCTTDTPAHLSTPLGAPHSSGCIHMALAFCTVFQGGDGRALHERFYSTSHFHKLFFALCNRKKSLGKRNKTLPLFEKRGKELFSIWQIGSQTQVVVQGEHAALQPLEKIFASWNEEESEENSIKFSHLSDSELDEWRKGAPSPFLKYELSPLSELSKWLFLSALSFREKSGRKPTVSILLDTSSSKDVFRCKWDFPGQFSCVIEGLMPYEMIELFEGLAKEKGFFQSIPQIVSCREKDLTTLSGMLSEDNDICVKVNFQAVSPRALETSREIFPDITRKWRISDEEGLIYKEPSLSSAGEEIEQVIVKDPALIETLLEEAFENGVDGLFEQRPIVQSAAVNTRRKELSVLSFLKGGVSKSHQEDSDIEISLEPYRLGRWIWDIHGKSKGKRSGRFIRASGIISIPFPEVRVIGKSLDDFLIQHRFWLSQQPGFKIHAAIEEAKVAYSIDPVSHALMFYRLSTQGKEKKNKKTVEPVASKIICDLGRWMWKEGEGFFPSAKSAEEASSSFGGLPFSSTTYKGIPLDTAIAPHRVPDFIQSHLETLKLFPGFFLQQPPIKEAGLRISYDARDQRIGISLFHVWNDDESEKQAFIYNDYGFLPGKGFFRIPVLPIQGTTPRSIEMSQHDEWERFFVEQLPKYRAEYSCIVDPRLLSPESLTLFCNRMDPEQIDDVQKGSLVPPLLPSEWEADFFWKSEKGEITLYELVKLVEKGNRFIPTPAGCLDVENDRFLWIRSLSGQIKKRGRRHKAGDHLQSPFKKRAEKRTIFLKTFDVLRIQAHDNFKFREEETARFADDHTRPHPFSIIKQILNYSPSSEPDISFLHSDLRPYQKAGLEWLWFLYMSGLSGLLCDDMGVGKTHQAMALFASVYHLFQQRKKEAPTLENSALVTDSKAFIPRFLIICPTSLVWHWREKLHKFVPDLSLFCYFGAERSAEGIEGDWNIFLTTYGIWRNEVSFLRRIKFDIAVFDELQIAKNHVSLVWSALHQVQSRMRLGLTGTPIENQLRELKALFDLVLPGYLPDEALFRELYIKPIERGDGLARRSLLSRAIKPFVLRRKKEEVLPELPLKTEELFLTELAPDQQVLYKQVASLQGLPLVHQLQDESQPIPYMHIFALLSALKQVCDHPACYLKDVSSYKQYESGKWQVFQELIEEAKESGQKVVVFSQYLNMLDIMSLYLDEMGIGHTEIRGRTKQRGKAIDRFRDDPSCLVFLGSLQAAGLGIDLTSASIVIHYDRWWNAARENQATDRVHRIGQSRGVQVIKMLTKATIEERIDKMIARKSGLLEEVINYDDHQIVKKMNREELLELLEGLDIYSQ